MDASPMPFPPSLRNWRSWRVAATGNPDIELHNRVPMFYFFLLLVSVHAVYAAEKSCTAALARPARGGGGGSAAASRNVTG